MSRYDISGSEGQYQPGSDNNVLRAIQAGRDGDYQHVERLIRDVLEGQQ